MTEKTKIKMELMKKDIINKELANYYFKQGRMVEKDS